MKLEVASKELTRLMIRKIPNNIHNLPKLTIIESQDTLEKTLSEKYRGKYIVLRAADINYKNMDYYLHRNYKVGARYFTFITKNFVIIYTDRTMIGANIIYEGEDYDRETARNYNKNSVKLEVNNWMKHDYQITEVDSACRIHYRSMKMYDKQRSLEISLNKLTSADVTRHACYSTIQIWIEEIQNELNRIKEENIQNKQITLL